TTAWPTSRAAAKFPWWARPSPRCRRSVGSVAPIDDWRADGASERGSMGNALMSDAVCWCGNRDLSPFSPGYATCQSCVSLVSLEMVSLDMCRQEITPVGEENRDFYGREYWFSHQEADLGQPNIVVRARADLPTRCLYWLRAVLKYKLPT